MTQRQQQTMDRPECEICGSIIRGRPQRITLDGFEITERMEVCAECFGAAAAFLYVDRENMSPVIDARSPPVVVEEIEDPTSGGETPG